MHIKSYNTEKYINLFFIRMSWPIVEILSGPETNIFHLSRASQRPYKPKIRKSFYFIYSLYIPIYIPIYPYIFPLYHFFGTPHSYQPRLGISYVSEICSPVIPLPLFRRIFALGGTGIHCELDACTDCTKINIYQEAS